MAREDSTVTFEDVKCTRDSPAAVLCNINGEEVWVPQSQITDDSEVYKKDTEGLLVVTRWWAEKRGLV